MRDVNAWAVEVLNDYEEIDCKRYRKLICFTILHDDAIYLRISEN